MKMVAKLLACKEGKPYRSYTLVSTLTSVLFLVGSAHAAIPRDGLVGEWLLNGNANDTSGNGNNGLVYGATLTSDRYGNANAAYSFDGINDKIIIPASDSYKPSNALSINLWAYVGDHQNTNTLISLQYRADGSNYYPWVAYSLYAGWSDTHPAAQFNDSYWGPAESSPLRQWTMYSVTWEGTRVGIYINGSLKHTGTFFGPLDYGTSGDLGIGGFPYVEYTDGYIPNFKGLIDDVRIYNRALSNSEIGFLASAAPIPEPETYAMLLAGLGLVGVVARRRKQKTA